MSDDSKFDKGAWQKAAEDLHIDAVSVPAVLAAIIGDMAVGDTLSAAVATRSDEDVQRATSIIFAMLLDLHYGIEAFDAEEVIGALGVMYRAVHAAEEQQLMQDAKGATKQ